MKIKVTTAIELGLRERQEDALFYADSRFAVADGMGGHEFGDKASKAAIRPLANWKVTAPENVRALMASADKAVGRLNKGFYRPPGSTLTAAFVLGSTCIVGHIGDTRCYHLSDGTLRQVTTDHGHGNIISRALGNWDFPASDRSKWQTLPDGTPTPFDVHEFTVKPGDALILCTDGVHGVMSDEDIKMMLDESGDNPASELVQAGMDSGSRDNLSAIVARFEM